MVSVLFKEIKLGLLLGIVLLCIGSCQQKPASNQVSLTQEQPLKFPQDWEGKWAGNLIITKPNGDTTMVSMKLDILWQDTSAGWDWTINYGLSESGIRAYELYPKNPEVGHYIIDEKNSIVLDAYYVGDSFYSRFQVSNNLIFTSTTRQGENLVYEITSGQGSHVSFSGGGDNIPTVKSYSVTVQQKAVLRRSK